MISPCVTFNDHRGSTKSYQYTRDNYNRLVYADFVPPAEEIATSIEVGDARSVQMHDGSRITFRKVPDDYDPTDRDQVYGYIRERQRAGEVATGLLYVEPAPRDGGEAVDFHGIQGTVDEPADGLPVRAPLSRSRRAGESAAAISVGDLRLLISFADPPEILRNPGCKITLHSCQWKTLRVLVCGSRRLASVLASPSSTSLTRLA